MKLLIKLTAFHNAEGSPSRLIFFFFPKIYKVGTSLIQWLIICAPTSGTLGSLPGEH